MWKQHEFPLHGVGRRYHSRPPGARAGGGQRASGTRRGLPPTALTIAGCHRGGGRGAGWAPHRNGYRHGLEPEPIPGTASGRPSYIPGGRLLPQRVTAPASGAHDGSAYRTSPVCGNGDKRFRVRAAFRPSFDPDVSGTPRSGAPSALSESCSRKAEGQDHGGGYIGKNEKVTGTLDYRIRSCSVDPQEELRIVRD